MPSQHAPDKICVSAWVPRTLQKRLSNKAKKEKKTLTELVEDLYNDATRDIELTPDDYIEIAKETEAARKRIDRRTRSKRAPHEAEEGG